MGQVRDINHVMQKDKNKNTFLINSHGQEKEKPTSSYLNII